MEAWKVSHFAALDNPKKGAEKNFLDMLRGWYEYADTHEERYASVIGEDYVLGPAWEKIGHSLRELLNGDIGDRLDAGSLDTIISDHLQANGCDTE